MKLPWSHDEQAVCSPGLPAAEDRVAGTQNCPSMAKVLTRLFRGGKPRILDLGPFCGATAVYLADRGARVSVDDFRPPPPTPQKQPGRSEEEQPPRAALKIDQPDAAFDLVLAWEHGDFTPPDRIAEFGAELRRVLDDGGWVLLFSLNDPRVQGGQVQAVQRYRLVADDRIAAEPSGQTRPRWVHPTRALERALAPLSIQGIHLQRNQIREFLALKPRDH